MTPQEREEKLDSIPLGGAKSHHAWLKECFAEELRQRLADPHYEHFENIYHCALLLHTIGDLTDLPLMYSAKCSGDMDLGCGFDWQFLFFKNPETLTEFARTIDRPEIAEWIAEYKQAYENEDMKMWLDGTIFYHQKD